MSGAAIVLCGGLSRRMGRPKALLPWRGRTLIEHVVGVMREAVAEVVVVSSRELELPKLDATVVIDRDPGLGPLAGIREGLRVVTAKFAFVTSTDAPFLTPRFVRFMLAYGEPVAPVIDGHVQTLCAVYENAPERASGLIDAGRMRPLFLLEASGYRALVRDELPDERALISFNTPEDYQRALREDGVECRT